MSELTMISKNVGNKQWFFETADLEGRLNSLARFEEKLFEEATHFRYAGGKDNTVTIILKNGTSLSETQIEDHIIYKFTTQPQKLRNVSRVQVVWNDEVVSFEWVVPGD